MDAMQNPHKYEDEDKIMTDQKKADNLPSLGGSMQHQNAGKRQKDLL